MAETTRVIRSGQFKSEVDETSELFGLLRASKEATFSDARINQVAAEERQIEHQRREIRQLKQQMETE